MTVVVVRHACSLYAIKINQKLVWQQCPWSRQIYRKSNSVWRPTHCISLMVLWRMPFGALAAFEVALALPLIYEFSSTTMLPICLLGTVWKFQDFSVSEILREINFGYFWSANTAISCIFGVSKVWFWWILALYVVMQKQSRVFKNV